MKKTLILFLVLAVSITAISVCSVSAADGAFYKFRFNFDFDTVNASYLYQRSMIDSTFTPLNNTGYFMYEKVDPVDYDGEYASFEFHPEVYGTGNQYYTGIVMPYGMSSLSKDNQPVVVTPDDTMYLEAGRFYVGIDTELDAIIKARFTLRAVDQITATGYGLFGGVIAYTDTLDIYISEGSRSYFDYPTMDFTFSDVYEDDVSTPVFLCVEFVFTTAEYLDITVMNYEVATARLFYASGSSPNNPIYPPADGGNVGNLDDAEQELIGSQQQGLDNTGTVIGNAENVILDLNTDLQLGAFVMALNPILDKITTIAGIDALVNMSLALGLFASLLSLSASIIGAGDKRASAQRKKDRNAKSATADRYADKGGGD